MSISSFLRLFAAFSMLTLSAWSQDVTGGVQGSVTDASSARIPEVNIELLNEATGVVATRTANGDGEFQFNLIPPGRYTVKGSLTGFRSASVTGIEVGVNKTTRVDLTM